ASVRSIKTHSFSPMTYDAREEVPNGKTRGLRPRVSWRAGARGPRPELASDGANTAGLLAFAALRDFEFDALVLGQGLEARALDLAEMREEVLATAVGGDEAEALGFVEPLDGSGLICHSITSLN